MGPGIKLGTAENVDKTKQGPDLPNTESIKARNEAVRLRREAFLLKVQGSQSEKPK